MDETTGAGGIGDRLAQARQEHSPPMLVPEPVRTARQSSLPDTRATTRSGSITRIATCPA